MKWIYGLVLFLCLFFVACDSSPISSMEDDVNEIADKAAYRENESMLSAKGEWNRYSSSSAKYCYDSYGYYVVCGSSSSTRYSSSSRVYYSSSSLGYCYDSYGYYTDCSSSSSFRSSSSSRYSSSVDKSQQVWNGKMEMPQTEYIDGKYYMIISSAEELAYFADQVTTKGNVALNAKLTTNIKLNPDSIVDSEGRLLVSELSLLPGTPIGYSASSTSYTGIFDGQGHIVSGVYVNNPNLDRAGFFGTLVDSAQVMNVGIENSYIVGKTYVGGLAGRANGSSKYKISRTFVRRSFIKGANAGGIVGYLNGMTIEDSYNTSYLHGSSRAGGIVGYKYSGKISTCYNIGLLSAPSSSACGISCKGESSNSYYASQYGVELIVRSATEMDADYMSTATFMSTLNSTSTEKSWTRRTTVNDGYPILKGEVE